VWRERWEQARDPGWKDKLVTFNAEDCAALKKVTEFVQALGDAARGRRAESRPAPPSPAVVWADQTIPSTRHQWCRPKFALQDFDYVNRCAYFDYQRDKGFVRTSKAVSGCADRYETDTHIFVHANYREDKPLMRQSGVMLRWRSLDDDRPGPHFTGKVAVVGHTPQKTGEILDIEHLVCIDTHCHGGGWLTALDVGSGR
jgi:hypothetical protein